MSNNLVLDQLTTNQSSKEATVNAATGQLDAAITESLDVDLTSGNATVTATNQNRNARLVIKNATVASRSVTLSGTGKRLFVVKMDSTSTQAVNLIRGSTTVSLTVGTSYLCYANGTNGLEATALGASGSLPTLAQYEIIRGGSGGTPQAEAVPYDVGSYFPSAQASASQVIFKFVAPRAFRLPSGASGSYSKADTAATGSTTLTIAKNGVSVGTIVYSAAGTSGAFTVSTNADFAAGDILTITGPGTADATLAGIATSLAMIRR